MSRNFLLTHAYTTKCPETSEVWLGLMNINGHCFVSTLQRLSPLLVSNATLEQKMQAANMLADSVTTTLTADKKKKDNKAALCLDFIVQ